jgi:hypothetical protein
MADAYGSTLDSLMANKIAQQGAQQAEANSYRNFLNQVSNTNLRRREGDALDRRGMEEMAINRMNVAGLNDYRRGQVEIGTADSQTRKYDAETGREGMRGLNTYRGALGEIGKTDAATRSYDAATTRDWRYGQNINDANRILSGEKVGLKGIEASITNTDRGARAMEYGADAGVQSTFLTTDAQMYGDRQRLAAASLPYDKLPRGAQLAYDSGGIEGLQQYNSANSPGSENMRLMRQSYQQEQDAQRRSAYGSTMDQLNKDFESEASGLSSFMPNSYRTKQIIAEQDRLKAQGMSEEQAYDEALGTVSRQIVDARFGSRPGVNEILREDRYDVPQGSQPQGRGMSAPTAAPTNAAPTRVLNRGGRQQPVSQNQPSQYQDEPVDQSQQFGPPSPADAFGSRMQQLRGMRSREISNAGAVGALTTPFFAGAADAMGVQPEQVGASNRYKRPRSVVADNWNNFGPQFESLPEDVRNSVYINSLNAASDVDGRYSPANSGYRGRELPSLDWMTRTQQ